MPNDPVASQSSNTPHPATGTNPPRSEVELWREYARRKNAWTDQHGYSDPAAYDAMITALCEELGL